MERAEQLGGDHAFVIADSIAAIVAAYAGREQEARTRAHAAIEKANRCGSPRLADQAIMSLGFLEVSLGNSADALTTLQPLMARFSTLPGTEIVTAAFLPDAIEAMIALGRIEDAEPMIEALEHHGRRLDRAWMLAMGARCRSMMLAAQGDVGAATSHRAAGDGRTSIVAHAVRTRSHSATTRPTPTPATPKRGRHNHVDGGAGCVRRNEDSVVGGPGPQ